ncbi:MAG: biotin/lipoyl-binding protein, partial [Burkholderiales bacterium]
MSKPSVLASGLSALAMELAAGAAFAADFDCLIEPRQTVEIRSAVTGLISSVNVRRGDVVKAGQVLVEIDPGLDKASAEVAAFRATMEGSKRTAEARVEFSDGKAARMTDLAENKFVSVQERDNAIAEKRLAAAGLLENQEERKMAALEHRRLLEQLRLRTLRAPFSGVVTD